MSKQRAKGTAYETAVVNYLQANGHDVQRTGSRDYGAGDIEGLHWAVECKNHAAIDLAGFVDQAVRAAERIGRPPVVIVKRRGKSVEESYVVMPLRVFTAEVLP